jgi:hypothetical protein
MRECFRFVRQRDALFVSNHIPEDGETANEQPTSRRHRAESCAYNVSKAAIGYTFGCRVLNPGSTESRYVVQLQTPLEGKWWFVASSVAEVEPPEEIRSVSYWEASY